MARTRLGQSEPAGPLGASPGRRATTGRSHNAAGHRRLATLCVAFSDGHCKNFAARLSSAVEA